MKSLVWLDPEKSRRKQDSNPASSAPEADALTTWPTKRPAGDGKVQNQKISHDRGAGEGGGVGGGGEEGGGRGGGGLVFRSRALTSLPVDGRVCVPLSLSLSPHSLSPPLSLSLFLSPPPPPPPPPHARRSVAYFVSNIGTTNDENNPPF